MNVLHCLFLEGNSDFLSKIKVKNTSDEETNSSSTRGNQHDVQEEVRRTTGILNPTTCLHLGDGILFTVSPHHYPQYDL